MPDRTDTRQMAAVSAMTDEDLQSLSVLVPGNCMHLPWEPGVDTYECWCCCARRELRRRREEADDLL